MTRNHRCAAVLLAFALAATLAHADEADDHLLTGAKHYRDGRYAEALVEFQVSLRLGGSNEALWYVAAALARLDRKQQALDAFLTAEAEAPAHADAVLAYHAAMACYALGLLTTADARLEKVQRQAGPRLAEQAAAARAAIAKTLAAPPPKSAVDALLDGARRFDARGRARLAAAFRAEAAALARRRPDAHRLAEAEAPAPPPADAGAPH